MANDFLNICPKCGSERIQFINNKKYFCSGCSFTYYRNVAAAAAVIIECSNKVLITRRNVEPEAGKLDLPGGFVDPGENLEQAVKREVFEELNIELNNLIYFGSYNNIYQYKGISYHTADAVFIAKYDNLRIKDFNHEIKEVLLIKPLEIDLKDIAFDSIKNAISDYIKNK